MSAPRVVGVSQPYLAMLESGKRAVTPALAREVVAAYGLKLFPELARRSWYPRGAGLPKPAMGCSNDDESNPDRPGRDDGQARDPGDADHG